MHESLFLSDLYEGTRMARLSDIPEIKQLLQPLEESGTLIRRSEEEVNLDAFYYGKILAKSASIWLMFVSLFFFHNYVFFTYSSLWRHCIHSLLWREKATL